MFRVMDSKPAWVGKKYRFIRDRWARILAKKSRHSFFVDSKGSKFLIQGKNALDQLIVTKGAIDGGLPYFLNDICDSNSLAIDVGANAGYYSIPFAQSFKEVHAYEPNPYMYEKLAKNVEINCFGNLTIHDIAIGEKVSTVDLFIQDSIDGDLNLNAGLSSLRSRPQFHRETIQVPILTIDSLNLTERVGLIKIDVEGTEFEVLRGAISTIKRFQPVIVWEASPSISEENFLGCISILSDLNYRHFEIRNELEISAYIKSSKYPSYDFNMLSVPIHSVATDTIENLLAE